MKAETMTAWEILLERAHKQLDPVAYAAVRLVEQGHANENTAVAIALERYAEDLDALRKEMQRYLEMDARPMISVKAGD
jgi:hypothetical protein